MLEWTGERFLPWIKESAIAYEHLHRYAYAATLARGKRVLDLACGEGYGSKMLAGTAASVLGVDIDAGVVAHAETRYGGPNLRFVTGSVTAVPVSESHSFDLIVCFEAIEHLEDHEKLLQEVKRLLEPGGTFIVSTPNKAIYHDEASEENPFHVKELYFEEFDRLLSKHFKRVRFLGQRIQPVSALWPIGEAGADAVEEFAVERRDEGFQFIPPDQRVPLYFIAIASDEAAAQPSPSILVDRSERLIKEKDELIKETNEELRATKSSAAEAIQWREGQIREREETIASLEEAVAWREGQIRDRDQQLQDRDLQIHDLNKGLEWTRQLVADREAAIASNEEALAWRAKQVEELQDAKTTLEERTAALDRELQNTKRQLSEASEQLGAIYASPGWKFILRVRHWRDRLLPAGSARRRLFERLMERERSRG